MMNLFERLGRTQPIEAASNPPHKNPPQVLLDWLLRRNRPTIKANDILTFGPRRLRNREIAASAAKVLVEYGWLKATKTRRCDMIEWEFIPRPLIHPNYSQKADE